MIQESAGQKRLKVLWPFMKRIYVLLVSVLLIIALSSKIAFFYGKSSSIEGHLFLLLKGTPPKSGELAIIEGHETAYHKDLIFLKRVVGTEGDVFYRKGNNLFLGETPLGPLRKRALNGKPLTPLIEGTKEGFFKIPPSKVFLKGDSPVSFDSRYKEFGLVDVKHIRGKAIRVF